MYRFTVDSLVERSKDYRLQSDGSWRRLDFRRKGASFLNIMDSDLILTDVREAKKYEKRKEIENIGEKTYFVNPNTVQVFSDKHAFVFPRLHRTRVPRRFTREELHSVIANGDDSIYNALILDFDGRFSLIDFHSPERIDSEIAVRNECFCAGNGYVGRDAANDGEHMDETYLGMLDGWIKHLTTRKLDIFVDETPDESEKELWEDVDIIFR